MSSGFFVGSKRGKEVGVVIGRVQCLHKIQHNVGNKTYTNLACFESCFCSGLELAMTKNFSVRRNHSLVVGEITFQVTYMLLYCRIINVVFTSRHVSVVWSASDITGITYKNWWLRIPLPRSAAGSRFATCANKTKLIRGAKAIRYIRIN